MTEIKTWALRRFQSQRSGKWRAQLLGTTHGGYRETSAIAKVEGATVTTKSGSVYVLTGKPAHNFAGFVPAWTPEDPLGSLDSTFAFECVT